MESLEAALRRTVRGEVKSDAASRAAASRDTSLFERVPALVVCPKDEDDVVAIVKTVRAAAERGEIASLAARAAGTDMSGGPLTRGVVVSFTEHINHVLGVDETASTAVAEPGVYYRDFEKATLEKGLLLPSYPASRELAALGGMVGNNAGGERTLKYGSTRRYVEELDVVLSDGSRAHFKALTRGELAEKKSLDSLEGEIYRRMDDLLTQNAALIAAKRPKVSKNSAGYALESVRDEAAGTFNLAKLLVGSQGTLALWTKGVFSLVRPKEHRAMLVLFLYDLTLLPEIVARVLPFGPESFESYDDHTFTLAVKLLPDLLAQIGLARALRLSARFIPEAAMVATGGVPKMVLMAEFAEDTIEEADRKVLAAKTALKDLPVQAKIEKNEHESEKYWIVRRESFSLLRKNLHGLYASPFIDDFVVPPSSYPRFLPKLTALLDRYRATFTYTIAGHIGNGNFHIIPLMDLSKEASRAAVLELAPQVYKLVIEEGGTTTGEHNDGIIRTPYLSMLFGDEMLALFEETKAIFDPKNIFNPGKKVGGTFADIAENMIRVNTKPA